MPNPDKAFTDHKHYPLYLDSSYPDMADEYKTAMEMIDSDVDALETKVQKVANLKGEAPIKVTAAETSKTVSLDYGNGLAKNGAGALEVPVDGVTIGYGSNGLHVIGNGGGGGGEGGYTLPTASTTVLGGVKSFTATAADDVDSYVNPTSGVLTGEIRAGAVTTDKIANGAVTNDKLAKDSVTTDKIKDGTITPDDLDKTKDWSKIFATSLPYSLDLAVKTAKLENLQHIATLKVGDIFDSLYDYRYSSISTTGNMGAIEKLTSSNNWTMKLPAGTYQSRSTGIGEKIANFVVPTEITTAINTTTERIPTFKAYWVRTAVAAGDTNTFTMASYDIVRNPK